MANLKLLLVLSIVAVIKSDDKFPIEPTHEKHSSSTGTSSHQPNITTTTLHPKTTTFVPPTINPTTSPNTTVSPNITTTTTTTAKPSTTTISTTITPPTTLKPNTTTTSTTTPKPTTTVPPTTPKPTTIAPPTPTPSPAPIPDPQTGNWSVNIKDSNYSCMVLDAAIQIEFLLGNNTKKVNLPVDAISEGNCQNDSDVINLKWDKNSLTLDFNQTVKDSKFELKSIKAVFVNLSLPVDTKNYTLVHNTPEFQTPLGNSYKCMKVQTLNLTEENGNKTIAYLHISNVQLQAFGNTTGDKFNAAIDCEASPITSDVVPIVVGCVLAALVIMIVVAYLIARRRCQARGYLSM